MTVWFDNPSLLFQKKEVFKFWPHPDQSFEDRINASSRFIIYAMCGLYLVKRDTRIIVLGFVALAGLYFLYNAPMNSMKKMINMDMFKNNSQTCTKPTVENPMANVLLTDYLTNPQRESACSTIKDRYMETQMGIGNTRSRAPLPQQQQYAMARQFITAPVSQIPNDQTSFAEFLYGTKNRTLCRDNPSACNPDARGVQLEAFGGLDPSDDIRGPTGGTRNTGGANPLS